MIPPNTGNIARLAVGIDARLHLIEPLGFDLDEKAVRRAGLDYWPHLDLSLHPNLQSFFETEKPDRLYPVTKFADKNYWDVSFKDGDYFLFGQETKGLPESVRNEHKSNCLGIPMNEKIRSLNLSNSVALVVYEAYRQINLR